MLTPLTEEGLKLPLRLPRYRRGYIRTKESSSRKDRAESKEIWNFFNWRRRDFLNIRIFFFFFFLCKRAKFPLLSILTRSPFALQSLTRAT